MVYWLIVSVFFAIIIIIKKGKEKSLSLKRPVALSAHSEKVFELRRL